MAINKYLNIYSAEDANYKKVDTILPIEFLNSLIPNGLTPHNLKLKIGAILMLLRNINLNEGLQRYQTSLNVILPRINPTPVIEDSHAMLINKAHYKSFYKIFSLCDEIRW